MADFKIKIAKYTLIVYETNKAHALGFFKWQLKFTHDELPEYPETTESSGNRYMVFDQALFEAVNSFYGHAGSRRFTCLNCRGGTHHDVDSVDLSEDGDHIIVYLICECGCKRTQEYFVKVIGE